MKPSEVAFRGLCFFRPPAYPNPGGGWGQSQHSKTCRSTAPVPLRRGLFQSDLYCIAGLQDLSAHPCPRRTASIIIDSHARREDLPRRHIREVRISSRGRRRVGTRDQQYARRGIDSRSYIHVGMAEDKTDPQDRNPQRGNFRGRWSSAICGWTASERA